MPERRRTSELCGVHVLCGTLQACPSGHGVPSECEKRAIIYMQYYGTSTSTCTDYHDNVIICHATIHVHVDLLAFLRIYMYV